MISSIKGTISALSAYEKKMAVISNNVANSQSEEFKKSRADLMEGSYGAVEVEISRIDSPGNIVYEKDSEGQMIEKELSNCGSIRRDTSDYCGPEGV